MALPNKDSANNQNSKPPPLAHLQPPSFQAVSSPLKSRSNTPNPNPPPALPKDELKVEGSDTRARYCQNSQDPTLYYQQPPARSRKPYNLHNTKKAGVPYKSTACITRHESFMIYTCLSSPQGFVMQVLLGIYHYRMNNVQSANHMTPAELRALFEIDLCEFPFSVHEIYKRYTMRKGKLGRWRNKDDLAWWRLPDDEMKMFISWLEDIAYWKSAGPAFILWRIGRNADDGKPWLKINASEFTLNFVQLFNSLHDSIYQWKNCLWGEDFLKSIKDAQSYYIS